MKASARALCRAIVGMCLASASLPVMAEEEPSLSPVIEPLPSPAPPNSHLPRVTSDEAGRVYLSWVTEQDEFASLQFSAWHAERWSDPTTISAGANWFVNWADFPMLTVQNGHKVAHWLQRSAEGTYDYDVVASFQAGPNAPWSPAQLINTDGVSAEHGFVSMTPTGSGGTLMAWLDGRDTKNTPDPGPMTLRAAEYTSRGHRLDEWSLDARVCDCCQTASAMTSRGPIVVYRDRSAREIRDIAIVRHVDGAWTQPRAVHDDGWQVAGCPVNGPAAAARGSELAVAWFTAAGDRPRVLLALSHDAGETFTPPMQVSGPDALGRVDLALLASGDVVVSWLDASAAQARVMLSRYRDGAHLDTTDVAVTSPSRRSGFPQVVGVDDTVYVTWTDLANGKQVGVARVRYAAAP